MSDCPQCLAKDSEIADLQVQLAHLEDVDRRRFARVLEEEQAARLKEHASDIDDLPLLRGFLCELIEALTGDKRLFREPPGVAQPHACGSGTKRK
jgi:hypothetical protein